MARYRMYDNTLFDTRKAKQSWKEARDWNRWSRIGRSTQSQWHYQTLHLSLKGRYYIEQTTKRRGQKDHAGEVSKRFAAAWLQLNEHAIPADLKAAAKEVSEVGALGCYA